MLQMQVTMQLTHILNTTVHNQFKSFYIQSIQYSADKNKDMQPDLLNICTSLCSILWVRVRAAAPQPL